MIRNRRDARERALQFLFQNDLNPPMDLAKDLKEFWTTQRLEAEDRKQDGPTYGEQPELPELTAEETSMVMFAESLIQGVVTDIESLDEEIGRYAKNWDVHRMPVVDRNILRLAIYELLHRNDIPPVSTINEAIEIAKKFSSPESGKFINGVLDRVKTTLSRAPRTAAEE